MPPWCTEDDRLADDATFEWDDANLDHIREAGVEREEAEEALLDPRRIRRDVYNLAASSAVAQLAQPKVAAFSSWCSPVGEDGRGSSRRAMPPRPRSAAIVNEGNDGCYQA